MKTAAVVSALAATALAAPFSFPLSNGFPSVTNITLGQISMEAGGPLPNSPPIKSLSQDAIERLKLVVANELFETAYFTQLVQNITLGIPGFELDGYNRTAVIRDFTRIIAQEELHAYGAIELLEEVGVPFMGTCEYTFPVDNFQDALTVAATFTDMVMGTLPDLQYVAGTQGGADDKTLIPLFGVVIANEGEQTGYIRSLLNKPPSSAPYMTGSLFEFAASVGWMFSTDVNCPAAYTATDNAIKPFKPLSVVTKPTFDNPNVTLKLNGTIDPATNGFVYISGQNVPVTVPFGNVTTNNGITTFSAAFPTNLTSTDSFSTALVLMLVTKTKGTYQNISAVAADTLYGPALFDFEY